METRSMNKNKRKFNNITLNDNDHSFPSLSNIILLCEYYIKNKKTPEIKKSSINIKTLKKLIKIHTELKELENFIGISDLKQTILEHVIYLAQNLNSEEDMNHIQIVGEPGVGKTTLARILGSIYAKLGFLRKGQVITITRSDLIGEHLGSTSIKTEQMLNYCRGNVMFIDEVYTFGCNDNRDSFSKECLDCINQYLSNYRKDILCIIAGYEKDINECFFNTNKGLERRFPFKYVLKKYNHNELRLIFISQVKSNKWFIDEKMTTLNEIFNESNLQYFTASGGDTEVLFMRCKMAYSTRIFGSNNNKFKKKMITDIDLIRGFEFFKSLKKKIQINEHVSMMYV